MLATVISVSRNGNDFQRPQIDIEVEYVERDWSRRTIFTLPYERFEAMDEPELVKLIQIQGESFVESLRRTEVMETKERDLAAFIGLEVAIVGAAAIEAAITP